MKRSGRPGPAAPVSSGHDRDSGLLGLGDPRSPPVGQGRLARTTITCAVPVALTHREVVRRLHTQGPGVGRGSAGPGALGIHEHVQLSLGSWVQIPPCPWSNRTTWARLPGPTLPANLFPQHLLLPGSAPVPTRVMCVPLLDFLSLSPPTGTLISQGREAPGSRTSPGFLAFTGRTE